MYLYIQVVVQVLVMYMIHSRRSVGRHSVSRQAVSHFKNSSQPQRAAQRASHKEKDTLFIIRKFGPKVNIEHNTVVP